MKVLVIGEGFGKRVVAPIYAQLGFESTILSPRDNEKIQQACAADFDLISVHSPPFLHHRHVMWALEAGRNVLCDKPFGRDANEAREMRDRAQEVGVLHFLNFEFRFQPARQKLKALLEDGEIGQLQHISGTFIGSGLRQQKHRWLFDASLAGGWIGAYGSHAIDGFRWLAGSEVVDCGGVSRIETTRRLDRDGVEQVSTAEDAFSAWFLMENGCTVSFDTAFSASVNMPQRLILMGSEGSLEMINELTLVLRRAGEAEQTFEFSSPEGDAHEPALLPWLTQVAQAVQAKQQTGTSFEDGVAAAEVMDQLRAKLIMAKNG